jgi:hypothetical protein
MTEAPDDVALDLATHLGTGAAPLEAALRRAHRASVGRHRDDLGEEQLADVLAEAGDLLRELGYAT